MGRVIALGNQVRQARHCGSVAAGYANAGRDPVHFRQLRGFPVTCHDKERVQYQVDGRVLPNELGVD
ncbi:hypothetical protein D3C86_2154600 [compost metagenome]